MSGFAIGIARSDLRTTAGDLVQIGELSSGGSYVARQKENRSADWLLIASGLFVKGRARCR